MSFLIRRNKPLAFAGWRDDFNRPDENPVQRPWARIGGSTTIEIENNQLKVGFGATDFVSGASYERQPFTPNWGYEFNMVFKNFPGYPAGQPFAVLMGPCWAKVNASFDLTVGFRWQSVTINDAALKMVLFPNNFAMGTVLFEKSYSAPFWTVPHSIRCWVDNDRVCRFWVDGILVGTGKLPSNYWFRENRRGANFNNQTFVSGYIDSYRIYDRPRDVVGWWDPDSPLFADDFNRPDSPDPGNGWTRFGNMNQAITSGSWGVTGTNDPARHIVQDYLLPETGDIRIEHTYATSPTAVNTAILARINAAGTVWLAVVITNGTLGIFRGSGSLTNPTYTQLQSHGEQIVVNSASKVALVIIGDEIYGELNGELVVGYTGANAISPRTNRRWGLMAARQFVNAGRIDNVKLFGQIAA